MAPKRLVTATGSLGDARQRRTVAAKYLEVAELIADEDGAAMNVCVGLAVLAGIAASDAVCLVGLGERYAGGDHSAAAEVLERVDKKLATRLRRLVALKPASHYGTTIMSTTQRTAALNAASALVAAATVRAQ